MIVGREGTDGGTEIGIEMLSILIRDHVGIDREMIGVRNNLVMIIFEGNWKGDNNRPERRREYDEKTETENRLKSLIVRVGYYQRDLNLIVI